MKSDRIIGKPDYWAVACEALVESDPVMAEIIKRFPEECLASHGEPFITLLRSIVGQQISIKAADSIWTRLMSTIAEPTPSAIMATSFDALRAAGLSARKADYITDLARHFSEGKLVADRWVRLDDETLIAELTAIRGIGRWTAEMLLIFSLLRPDVLPADDIGLQRAAVLHYPELVDGVGKLTSKAFAQWGQRWAPWRTVASWYLWRSLDPGPVTY